MSESSDSLDQRIRSLVREEVNIVLEEKQIVTPVSEPDHVSTDEGLFFWEYNGSENPEDFLWANPNGGEPVRFKVRRCPSPNDSPEADKWFQEFLPVQGRPGSNRSEPGPAWNQAKKRVYEQKIGELPEFLRT